jgi:hypothetical protein
MMRVMGMNSASRKVRSDKKHSIAPYVPDTYRVWIHRIARHLEIPEGEVGVRLIECAVKSEECIRFFSPYFKRNFSYGNQVFLGHEYAALIDSYIEINGKRDRFKVRVNKCLYDKISEFQIALGSSFLSHATHALLRYGLHTKDMVHRVAPNINYDDLFYNAPIPRPHTQLFITDLAFPKKTKEKLEKDKVKAIHIVQESDRIYDPKRIDVTENNQKRSVWSVL